LVAPQEGLSSVSKYYVIPHSAHAQIIICSHKYHYFKNQYAFVRSDMGANVFLFLYFLQPKYTFHSYNGIFPTTVHMCTRIHIL
jgi:hypothetical protein